MNVIRLGPEYFPTSNRGVPISNGYIYVGIPDLDPEIPANQKTVSAQQESGVIVPISQPVRTSAGGIPIYNNSPVTLLVDGDYSLKVLNSTGAQVYYGPNHSYETDSNVYYLDYTQPDQGANTTGSLLNILNTYGTTNKYTIVVRHNSALANTDYTFLTSLNASTYTNVTLSFENGARLKDSASDPNFTWGGQIEALPNQQVSNWGNGSGTILFSNNIPVVYTGWFGDTGDGTTDDYPAIQRAIDIAQASSTHTTVAITPLGVHKLSDQLEIDATSFITIDGLNRKGNYLFHRPSGGTEACIKITGNTIITSGTTRAVNGDGNITIKHISLGSTVGPAFWGLYMTHSYMEDVWMFSAGATASYCLLEGCNMNTFNSCGFSRGNQEYPAEYNSVLSANFTDGLYGLNISAPLHTDGIRYTSPGELFFWGCRTDGATGSHSVIISTPNVSALGAPIVEFHGCKFTGNSVPNSIVYVKRAAVSMHGTILEGSVANTPAIFIDNTDGVTQVYLYDVLGVTDSYIYAYNGSTEYVDLVINGGSFGKFQNDLASGWRTLSIENSQFTTGLTGAWTNYTGAQCLSLKNNRTYNAGQAQDYQKLVGSTSPYVMDVYNYSANTNPVSVGLYKGRGTPASPANANSGDNVGEVAFYARANGSFVGAGIIYVNAPTISGADVTGNMYLSVKNGPSGYVNDLVLETTKITAAVPISLPTYTDAAAPNSTLYFSSTTSKLTWKDSGGSANALY